MHLLDGFRVRRIRPFCIECMNNEKQVDHDAQLAMDRFFLMSDKKISSVFHFGVRQKVMLVLITVLLVALSVSGWMALQQEKDDTLKEINRRGSDISRFVAKSMTFGVVGYDYHTIQLLVDDITFSDDINYAKVVNGKGNVMAESGELLAKTNPNQVLFHQDIKFEDEVIGTLTLGLSTENIIKRLESQKFSLVQREAIIILLIALGEFLALSFIIVRPVSVMSKSLSESVDESGQIVGEVPVISQDEFGKLAVQFNSMSAQLNDANARLQSRVDIADKKLMQTNRQLLNQSEELRQINEKFRKMSITDALTNLYNRRRFEEILETELAMSLEQGETNSILVIDIDHFKRINDTYGHPCGDAVLRTISKVLKNNLRKTDLLCRVGGEEFVAICRRADKTAALEIGEKMQRDIEKENILFGDLRINVTISIGIATSDEKNKTYSGETLYRNADKAVYESKETGRNKVTHFDQIDMCMKPFSTTKLTSV